MKLLFKYAITVLVVILLVPITTNAQTIKRSKQKTEQKKNQSDNSSNKNNTQKTDSSSKTGKPSGKKRSSRSGTSSQSSRTKLPVVVQKAIDDMVWVKGGSFTMGATSEQGRDVTDYENPHQVTLSGYYISKYEVTQALWQAVMGSNPSYVSSREGYTENLQRPVECVSWSDCQTFITKLNALTGKHFRLPTEAEWEYAARGGNRSRGYKYAGSNRVGDVAWYWGNSEDTTHPVGTKSPNELSLYDMSGNVAEWCQDWAGYYSSDSQMNPTGPSSGSDHIYRGGSWGCLDSFCRVAFRNYLSSSQPFYLVGLRLAASSL